jgi:hypothetical protein
MRGPDRNAQGFDAGAARRAFWFAVVIFVVVAGTEAYLLINGFPGQMKAPELTGRLLGTLDATMLAAIYYIFGSSAASVRGPARHDDKGAAP